jgi:TPR repeat protein
MGGEDAAELGRRLALEGDPEAQYHLGWTLEGGRGESADLIRALALYDEAAELGHEMAAPKFEQIMEAQGVSEALRLVFGDEDFERDLAMMPHLPDGLSVRLQRSDRWGMGQNFYRHSGADLRKKIEDRDPLSMRLLAMSYMDQVLPAPEPLIGYRYIRRAAALGDVGAQAIMGAWCLGGEGPEPKNLSEAKRWLLSSAEGQSDYGYPMGLLWKLALEDPSVLSLEEGLKWLIKGAANSDPEAECLYGEALADGSHVRQDLGAALKYLKRAAQKGHPKAMTKLASLRENRL